jgi:L-alanine-DL-glutamate epimerase-like enolase superfamily enzyme
MCVKYVKGRWSASELHRSCSTLEFARCDVPSLLSTIYDVCDFCLMSQRFEVLREAWMVENRHLHVPDRPGMGVELEEDVIAANPYRPRSGKRNAFGADGSVADV